MSTNDDKSMDTTTKSLTVEEYDKALMDMADTWASLN
jgi:hypothetical protein